MFNIGKLKWNRAETALNHWSSQSEKDKDSLELTILKALFYCNREQLRNTLESMLPISPFESGVQFHRVEFDLAEDALQKNDDTDQLLTKIESELAFDQNIMQKRVEHDSYYYRKLTEKNINILKGILNGNQSVFREFYEIEFPVIVQMILRYGGTVEDARDIFQDALIVIIEKAIHSQLNLKCSLDTYIYSISRNKWRNHLRKIQPEVSYDDNFDHSSGEMTIWDVDPTDDKKLDNAIQIIGTLGKKCKMLLDYYYYRKMSWQEISKQLGYSNAASARNQKYKCLERIKYQLQFYD